MALVTVDQYNDQGITIRTSGEALTVSGATYTQRTDTRWHASGVANLMGTYSYITINAEAGGTYSIDATNVKWLPISNGSGTCGIGSTIVQGDSSGYFLGAYSSLTAAPSTTIPSTGFIKIREMYNGTISGGAISISGIAMTATGPLVTGWLEVIMDDGSATAITVPRLGQFKTRGEWFELEPTNGMSGQLIQVPTNGGGAGTFAPGLWVETNPGTSEFEYYPSLSGAANGWAQQHISHPSGTAPDPRQKFVKALPDGVMQFGEPITTSFTYTTAPISGTYTWVSGVLTVAATAHKLKVTDQVYLAFVSGGALTYDGLYTVATAATANTFTTTLSGAGTVGGVYMWAQSTITTPAAHLLTSGMLVGLNFTNGGLTGRDNFYIENTTATTTFTVNTHTPSDVAGSGIIQQTIGYIPPSGCRIRIPNIFLRSSAVGTRNLNSTPNTVISTRPEFVTTSAGNIDSEFCYSNWYHSFGQPYSIKIFNSAIFDNVVITECATPLNISGLGVSMFGAFDANALNLTSNFAGGTVTECTLQRGNTPGSTDHAFNISNCNDISFSNIKAGIIQYYRSTGYSYGVSTCNRLTFTNCKSINTLYINIATSRYITFKNTDHCERYMGITTPASASYCFSINPGCANIIIDGITFGLGGIIPNCHPYAGAWTAAGSTDIVIRNMGSRSNMLSGGSIPLYAMAVPIYLAGNNSRVKIQRIYFLTETLRSQCLTESNTENFVTHESMFSYKYKTSLGVITNNSVAPMSLNSTYKGIGYNGNTVTGQWSVYGTHWADLFTSDTIGRVLQCMNESTPSTLSLNTLVLSGTLGGFTSAGSLALPTSGDVYYTECPYFIKGHTGFTSTAPIVNGISVTYSSGSKWGNHRISYQLHNGTAWNGTWKDLNGTNLSEESISPTGFKLKYKVECDKSQGNNSISFIRVETTSTLAAQADNLYDLDTNTVTLTGLKDGSEVRAYVGTNPSTAVEVGGIESSSTSFTFSHSVTGAGYIQVFALGWLPILLDWTFSAEDKTVPVQQVIDRQYNII